jgi:hypothetical protein
VIGQFYRNGERISGADEHERGRTRAVLGCVRQSNYRTNHSASGAAVILWALYLAAVVYPDDDSLLASLKSIELRDTNQKSTLNLTAKLPSLFNKRYTLVAYRNVMKRKNGKYTQRTLWYKILNPSYIQKAGRQEFFQRQ